MQLIIRCFVDHGDERGENQRGESYSDPLQCAGSEVAKKWEDELVHDRGEGDTDHGSDHGDPQLH